MRGCRYFCRRESCKVCRKTCTAARSRPATGIYEVQIESKRNFVAYHVPAVVRRCGNAGWSKQIYRFFEGKRSEVLADTARHADGFCQFAVCFAVGICRQHVVCRSWRAGVHRTAFRRNAERVQNMQGQRLPLCRAQQGNRLARGLCKLFAVQSACRLRRFLQKQRLLACRLRVVLCA